MMANVVLINIDRRGELAMTGPVISREKKTIQDMIELYCQGNHGKSESLCEECRSLLEYAWQRLDRCKFGEQKPNCSKCSIHCYRPEMRERVVAVMRYSGPRMLCRNPLAAIRHLLRR